MVMNKILIISLSYCLLFFSCSGNDYDFEEKSSKGDWTSSDKESAKEWLIAEFDLNQTGKTQETEWAYETIDCMVRRMETHYDNLEEAQFDTEGVGDLGAQCGLKYLLESIKKKNSESEYEEEERGC